MQADRHIHTHIHADTITYTNTRTQTHITHTHSLHPQTSTLHPETNTHTHNHTHTHLVTRTCFVQTLTLFLLLVFQFRTHKIKDGHYGTCLPFVLCDVMGLERGESQGAHPDDLVQALQGHIKDGHRAQFEYFYYVFFFICVYG